MKKDKECQEGNHSLVLVDDEKFTELATYCVREGCDYSD